MYLPLDMPPITNYQVQEYIVEYTSSLDFVDDMSDIVKWEYFMGTENYLNLNEKQFEYLEYVYYPIIEEQERQRELEERQRELEEQQRELEERQKELEEYRIIVSQNPSVAIDSETSPDDICHLGGGIVVKCSEFYN